MLLDWQHLLNCNFWCHRPLTECELLPPPRLWWRGAGADSLSLVLSSVLDPLVKWINKTSDKKLIISSWFNSNEFYQTSMPQLVLNAAQPIYHRLSSPFSYSPRVFHEKLNQTHKKHPPRKIEKISNCEVELKIFKWNHRVSTFYQAPVMCALYTKLTGIPCWLSNQPQFKYCSATVFDKSKSSLFHSQM
jgi:hypothetical protein